MRILHSLSLFLAIVTAVAAAQERVTVKADFSECDAVLKILDHRKAGRRNIAQKEWDALFETEPYRRLKMREAAMKRPFTDEEFKKFVLSDEVARRRDALMATVAAWKKVDLAAYGRQVLEYLPAESQIHTKVFPLIKPQHNSFVFDQESDPAIFLYVNPDESSATFANTVAHEMHHIGLSSVDKKYDAMIASLPGPAHTVAEWMGAFGEGEAVLAAAGGPDHYPVGDPTPELKANWARGEREFNQDLGNVNQFFLDVLSGKLKQDAVQQAGGEFFGLQGPWYTVGYKMAVMVEKRYGRARLIDCMRDRRLLLVLYNQAAEEQNRDGKEKLALWSPEILKATEAPTP